MNADHLPDGAQRERARIHATLMAWDEAEREYQERCALEDHADQRAVLNTTWIARVWRWVKGAL